MAPTSKRRARQPSPSRAGEPRAKEARDEENTCCVSSLLPWPSIAQIAAHGEPIAHLQNSHAEGLKRMDFGEPTSNRLILRMRGIESKKLGTKTLGRCRGLGDVTYHLISRGIFAIPLIVPKSINYSVAASGVEPATSRPGQLQRRFTGVRVSQPFRSYVEVVT